MCVCVCACVPRKRFLGNYLGHHHQTGHGNYLRHANAFRVNYIDLDLHARSHRFNHENDKCAIISETVQAIPIQFAVKMVRLKVYIIFNQSEDFTLHSRSQLRLKREKNV